MLYKKSSQAGQPGPGAPGQEESSAQGSQKRDDDVVDAEFEDVKK
jgi:hypothetical protein